MIDFAGTLEPFSSADPQPQGDEVVLRVRACGVCHSDVHLRDGYYDHGDGKHVKLPHGRGSLRAAARDRG
jgi:D-arabinose 1-dehydrogenase-like Zn-dependent alcohol dehydrogenase